MVAAGRRDLLIQVEGLRQAFGGREVLKGIDLQVGDREILAVMGSSGGGKTTLLRAIAGLAKFTAGKITVDGIDVREDPEEARRRMGLVFQSAALFDSMTVRENVLFGIERRLKLEPKERRSLAEQALSVVGLQPDDAKKYPSELSGGMRKRVGLARALALDPKIVLYDEPTTGLDPITTYAIDRLVATLRDERGVTSLVVSHDLASVVRVADRVAFLHQGTLAFLGTPDDFVRDEHPAIVELVKASRSTTLDD
ncbi:ATP-binding cassette domain-containing protein [bacterium]|nr:MAG: ATP-binding cassette domain-containing protein [bacterium]